MRLAPLAALAFLAFGHTNMGCVDGVTPDCSDADVCAPNQGSGATNDGGGTEAGDASGE